MKWGVLLHELEKLEKGIRSRSSVYWCTVYLFITCGLINMISDVSATLVFINNPTVKFKRYLGSTPVCFWLPAITVMMSKRIMQVVVRGSHIITLVTLPGKLMSGLCWLHHLIWLLSHLIWMFYGVNSQTDLMKSCVCVTLQFVFPF